MTGVPTEARNLLGVMQGRLLPKYNGRYQAYPVGYWQEEFSKAAEFGLDCIEFILDYEGAEDNPLLGEGGVDEILQITEETGVMVRSVCADYFMEAPLHHLEESIAAHSQAILRRLIRRGQKLGLSDIVIPCVDQSSMRDGAAIERFVQRLLPLVVESEINLSLETDLAPQPFSELLDRFRTHRVTVNYDTGNSASLGYDPVEELACYGNRISDIHLKDRVLDGGSVPLGTGDTQFERFFNALRSIHFTGPFIMQAYRDDEGVEVFHRQLEWVRSHFQL